MRRLLIATALALAWTWGAAAGLGAPAHWDVTTIPVTGEPRVGAVSGDALWVLADRAGERHLIEIPSSATAAGRDLVLATGVRRDLDFLSPSDVRPSLAVTPGALWTTDPVTRTVIRVRPDAGAVDRLDVPGRYVATGPAGLWVLPARGTSGPAASPGIRYRLVRLDPALGVVADERVIGPGLGSLGPVELAVGADQLSLSLISPRRKRSVIDLTTGSHRHVAGGAWQLASRGATLAATDRNACVVYVTDEGRSTVRIPMAPRVARGLGECSLNARDTALGPGGRVWAVFARGTRRGVLAGRTRGSRAPARTVTVGRDPVDVVAGRGVVWVLNRADRTVMRIRLAPPGA